MVKPRDDTALPLHNLQTDASSSLLQPPSAEPRSSRPLSASLTGSYALLSPSGTAEKLRTSLTYGIPEHDAEARLHQYGLNELSHEEPEPLWLRFLKQFKEPLIGLLLGSAVVSLLVGNSDDALSIAVAVTIVVTVGFVQEYRSEQSIEALSKLVPHYAHLIRSTDPRAANPAYTNGSADGKGPRPASSTVAASQLVPGDLVLFSTGDRIPADVRIIEATDLAIDESNLTGENEAVAKRTAALDLSHRQQDRSRPPSPGVSPPALGTVGADVRLNEQVNIGFMGTLVRSGHGMGIVVATGGSTEFGAISASLGEIESPRTPLQLAMDKLGQELSYMSFIVIGFIVVVGLLQGMKFLEMFTTGVSLAVAAIPEGLPIIVTVTLALGVLRMAKRGAIVRRLPSVETLGSVNVVCSDKTGTLTQNHMTVTKIWHADMQAPLDVAKERLEELDNATRSILRIGNVANNARLSQQLGSSPASAASAALLSATDSGDATHQKSRWVGSPTDVALLDLLDMLHEEDIRERLGERSAETPFSSERKWMGVVHGAVPGSENPGSATVFIKGALERVLDRCDSYLTKDGREVVLDEARRKAAIDAAEHMASEGLRVIAFASATIRDQSRLKKSNPSSRSGTPANAKDVKVNADDDLYRGLALTGLVGMNDPPRKGVDRAIRRLMAGGVKVVMITGDAETTALAIAKQLGMHIPPTRGNAEEGGVVLRGDQLDHMSEDELAQAIARTSIFARTSPEHKLKIIRAYQSRGDVVAMTGDGVNDAPALKKADIGISMGVLGTDVAKEAADMILTDDNFATILHAIEEGKGIFYNVQNFITFQLSTSVAALSLTLLSVVMRLKQPLNPMQILWINILMDGPPAQSLGVEPVDPAVMSRPPRSRTARALTRALIQRVLTSAALIMTGVMFVFIHEMSVDHKVTARDTTMTFTAFVFFDMFNALTCRSEGKSLLRGEIQLFGNRMFNFAVGGSLLGQMAVIYLPILQGVFQTEALGFWDLVGLAAIASSVLWVDEGRKLWKRRSSRGYGGYSGNV